MGLLAEGRGAKANTGTTEEVEEVETVISKINPIVLKALEAILNSPKFGTNNFILDGIRAKIRTGGYSLSDIAAQKISFMHFMITSLPNTLSSSFKSNFDYETQKLLNPLFELLETLLNAKDPTEEVNNFFENKQNEQWALFQDSICDFALLLQKKVQLERSFLISEESEKKIEIIDNTEDENQIEKFFNLLSQPIEIKSPIQLQIEQVEQFFEKYGQAPLVTKDIEISLLKLKTLSAITNTPYFKNLGEKLENTHNIYALYVEIVRWIHAVHTTAENRINRAIKSWYWIL